MRSHLKSLWGSLWPLPGGVPALYAVAVAAFASFRVEPAIMAALACILAYSSGATKRFYLAILPFGLVGIAYDTLRYLRGWFATPSRIIGCEMRQAELHLFPIDARTTLQGWLSLHHNPLLDLICAVPYFAFLYVVAGYSVYLYFVDRRRMHTFVWAYAIGNLLAFVCWLAIPVAPPWYINAYGCQIHLDALPSAAALVRVDVRLHTGYFEHFYSRSNFVFGALPSLHCAYPLMGLLVCPPKANCGARIFHASYVLLMAFSAMYLDHHWTLDVLAGWCVAALSVWGANQLLERVPELTSRVVTSPVKMPAAVGTTARN